MDDTDEENEEFQNVKNLFTKKQMGYKELDLSSKLTKTDIIDNRLPLHKLQQMFHNKKRT